MNNLDVQALRRIFDLLQTHFPERLSELWFLNAPWIFWGAEYETVLHGTLRTMMLTPQAHSPQVPALSLLATISSVLP